MFKYLFLFLVLKTYSETVEWHAVMYNDEGCTTEVVHALQTMDLSMEGCDAIPDGNSTIYVHMICEEENVIQQRFFSDASCTDLTGERTYFYDDCTAEPEEGLYYKVTWEGMCRNNERPVIKIVMGFSGNCADDYDPNAVAQSIVEYLDAVDDTNDVSVGDCVAKRRRSLTEGFEVVADVTADESDVDSALAQVEDPAFADAVGADSVEATVVYETDAEEVNGASEESNEIEELEAKGLPFLIILGMLGSIMVIIYFFRESSKKPVKKEDMLLDPKKQDPRASKRVPRHVHV